MFKKILFTLTIIFLLTNISYSADAAGLQQLKSQVEEGKISPNEALSKARTMGASEEMINVAEEKLKKNQENEVAKVESKLKELAKTEKTTTKDEVLEKIENKKIKTDSLQNIGDKKLNYFGYDFLKGNNRFSPANIGPVNPNYQVGPGDELIINLWGETELRYVKTISREGTIYLDNIGLITVNGYTLEKLNERLLNLMSRAYSSLKPVSGKASTFIDVTLGKLKAITVYIVGEVENPGAYQIDSYSTAFSALHHLGGPTTKGSLRKIQVIRDGKVETEFDLYDYLLSGKQIKDIRLQNNDHIFIQPRLSTITLKGGVNHPAIFELKSNETLADLIRFSGGLTTEADINRVQIERTLAFADRSITNSFKRLSKYDKKEMIDERLVTKKGNNLQLTPLPLHDLDIITVYKLIDENEMFASVTGPVYREGKFSISDGLTLKQLIIKAEGLMPDAYLEKGYITRTYADSSQAHINFSLNSDILDTLKIKERDVIKLLSIWDIQTKEKVIIEGHVKAPGIYNLNKEMKIADLLFKAGGLENEYFKKQTYLVRADLIRYNEDQLTTKIIPIRLNKILDGDFEDNLLLKHRDKLIIYDASVLNYAQTVTISGDVYNPGEFELQTNMTIHDLILRAGGLKKSALRKWVEVFRVDPYDVKENKLAIVHKEKLKADFLTELRTNQNFKLEDHDLVVIRTHPDFQYQRNVTLLGEVKFPGVYTLLKKNEKLSDVIERAGGLTSEAFIEGTYLTRNNSRVVGDYEELFTDEEHNPKLVHNDSILIPKHPGTVFVEGFVNSPGYAKYNPNWDLEDYINAAGSFNPNGEVDKIIVFYAGGAADKDSFWSTPEIREGSRIVVYEKPEQEPTRWTEVWKDWAAVLTSTLTIFYIIKNS